MIREVRSVMRWIALAVALGASAAAADLPPPPNRFARIPILAARMRVAPSPDLPSISPLNLGVTAAEIPSGTMSNEFGTPAINGTVNALVYWNGSLVIGGTFTAIGASPFRSVARWDGSAWQPLGSLNYGVTALAVWQGQLVAAEGGNLQRWNGSTWEMLGPALNGWISALTAADSVLVFGGQFSDGGEYGLRIGRWNGTTVTWMGGPVALYPYTIAAFGGEWYAGGSMVQPGGHDALMRFDGSDWQPLGVTASNGYPTVLAMSVLNGELLVGGWFDSAGTVAASGIARWNGSTWSTVPESGPGSTVFSMAVEGDSVVHIGGLLKGSTGLFRWNGAFLTLEPGPAFATALATGSSRLAAAGPFDEVQGHITCQIAERGPAGWQALEEWHPPMRGLAAPGPSYVRQYVAYTGGVVASGYFTVAANDMAWMRAWGIASWKDGAWHPMEGGGFQDLVVHDGELYGVNGYVGRWNGAGWDGIGTVSNAGQCASAGGALYVGSDSYQGYSAVWRWDDPAWTLLPHPDGIPVSAGVTEMIADGTNLVVSWEWPDHGRLTSWDGSAWSLISEIMYGPLRTLGTWNGKLFAKMGSQWNDPLMVREGGVWKPTGLTGPVTSLTTLGPWLVAAGTLQSPTLRPPATVATWDGAQWTPLPIDRTNVQAVFGDGHSLWIGSYSSTNPQGGAVSRWDWDGIVPMPPVNALASVAPNPFSTSVALRFSLARLGKTRLAIYDIAGHEVARLWNDILGAGDHVLTWDGRDRNGNNAPAGIYFARLLVDDRSVQSQRIVLMR